MSQRLDPAQFKRQVAEFFNDRANYDRESDFHPRLAQRLIEFADLQPGQKVLDIATGTGLVAIAVAQLVAPTGWVVGVDISEGMLAQAKRKIQALNLANISLYLTDAEGLRVPDGCFDGVLCSSALVYLTNIPGNLCRWHQWLKPGGLVGFHGFAETAFVASVLLQQIAERYGVSLVFNQPTGTPEKCRSLLQTAGFGTITIHTEQFGSYITLNEAKQLWQPDSKNPLFHPLRQLSPETLEQMKLEYVADLEAIATDDGIWNDITTFFVFGRKLQLYSCRHMQ